MENNMTEVRNFIDLVAAGNNADAKEALSELLSARAFESLDDKKKEMASSLFNGVEVQEAE
jgi:hypothetical protein